MRKSVILLSFILQSLLLFTACAPEAPVQTAVSGSDSLIIATFNDTTTLHFRVIAADEAELVWDATDGKNYNSPSRYQHRGSLVVPSAVEFGGKMAILSLSLPILRKLIDLIAEFLS